MKRVRMVAMVLQAQLVVDDGTDLRPLSTQPVTVVAADWPSVVQIMDKALSDLQGRLDDEAGGG